MCIGRDIYIHIYIYIYIKGHYQELLLGLQGPEVEQDNNFGVVLDVCCLS